MEKDPLDAVFMSPEEQLTMYLRAMPKNLVPVFEREFMRRPTQREGDWLYCPHCGELMSSHLITERGGNCKPARRI